MVFPIGKSYVNKFATAAAASETTFTHIYTYNSTMMTVTTTTMRRSSQRFIKRLNPRGA